MLAELAICVVSVVVVGGNPVAADESASGDELRLIAIEREIIETTNRQRQRYGLRALEVDPELVRSARRHAAWMTNNRTLRHTNAAVAENIAMGQRDAYEAVSDWMASPGHRANILNSRYRRIGAAAYRTPDGTIFWCQQFLY